MSEIKFECPQCRQHIQCDEASYAGRQIACPACGALMVVPGTPGPALAVPSAATTVCRSCGAALMPGTALCLQCGFNQHTGQRLPPPAAASASAPSAAALARAGARAKAAAAAAAGAAKWHQKPLVWLGILLGFFGLLYLFARFNPIGAACYVVAALGFYVVVHIWMLVAAFREDRIQGMLALFCGPYQPYFVFVKSESPMLKVFYSVALVNFLGIGSLEGALEHFKE